jgi:DNA invertase Pin-like site-specific DNA recombinase
MAALTYIGTGILIAEYTDIETGKRHENRPQLKAALEHCRRARAVLLIACLDRLARNVHFISGLMESGVPFVAADMPNASPFEIHIRAAMAEEEARRISQRTKAALAAAKARGVKLGNPRLAEARARAREVLRQQMPPESIVALISALRREGRTFRDIAAQLNADAMPTPRGRRWHLSTARAVFLRLKPEAADPYAAMAGVLYEDLIEAPVAATPFFVGSTTGREPTQKGGMPMPSNIQEAERMHHLFTSVGANSFTVTKTDVDQKLIWGKNYSAMELSKKLAAMVRTADIQKPYMMPDGKIIAGGENLIVRPVGPETVFVQLDDLSAEQLDHVRPASFLIICTSPGNHQAWIAASGLDKSESKDFVRRVRKAVGDADMSASGATRMAGTANFKPKYFPNFPTVEIIHGVPGRTMTPEMLQGMGLLAEPEPARAAPLRVSHSSGGRIWPDYAKCVAGAPMNHSGTAVDISRADYFWCFLSAQWGNQPEEIATRLMELSAKAKENGEQYASTTARNAYATATAKKRAR